MHIRVFFVEFLQDGHLATVFLFQFHICRVDTGIDSLVIQYSCRKVASTLFAGYEELVFELITVADWVHELITNSS